MHPRTILAAVAITGLLSSILTPAATAAPAHWSAFALRVDVVYQHNDARWATLHCDPDGGKHPRPGAACDQLRAAHGHVRRIPSDDGPCTMEYNPTRVTASGLWRGQHRWYSRVHSNPCVANRLTGGVLFAY